MLYSSASAISPDGTPLPISSLALTLDDEVQYRCAGYIQAEIERYAEFLDDEDDDDDDVQQSDAEGGSDAQDNADADKAAKAKRAKKLKKTTNEGLF